MTVREGFRLIAAIVATAALTNALWTTPNRGQYRNGLLCVFVVSLFVCCMTLLEDRKDK